MCIIATDITEKILSSKISVRLLGYGKHLKQVLPAVYVLQYT